jgi:hypothetical protein
VTRTLAFRWLAVWLVQNSEIKTPAAKVIAIAAIASKMLEIRIVAITDSSSVGSLGGAPADRVAVPNGFRTVAHGSGETAARPPWRIDFTLALHVITEIVTGPVAHHVPARSLKVPVTRTAEDRFWVQNHRYRKYQERDIADSSHRKPPR